MSASIDPAPRSRKPELLSIAKSIEPAFPDAANLLRGIAREIHEQAEALAAARTEGGGAR